MRFLFARFFAEVFADFQDLQRKKAIHSKDYNMVKQGYKQTEVGVIPEDWEVKKLGDVALNIASGKSNTQNYDSGVFPIYGSTGIIGMKSYYDYEGEKITVARDGANASKINFI